MASFAGVITYLLDIASRPAIPRNPYAWALGSALACAAGANWTFGCVGEKLVLEERSEFPPHATETSVDAKNTWKTLFTAKRSCG